MWVIKNFLLLLVLILRDGGGVFDLPPPQNSRVKNFVYRLIFLSKCYIPNLGPLGPFLHVEKFLVVVVVVVETLFSVQLSP